MIVVIGGGPAGMMAAIRAGQNGKPVILLEKKSSLGNKLLLSGKGRCNLTNACDLDSFLKRFSHQGQFLRDSFKIFFNRELMQFFKDRGLELQVERQLRVFPAIERSAGVLEVLQKELRKVNANVRLDTAVEHIALERNKVSGVIVQGGKFIPAEKVILATGGISYSFTGSTGEGLALAKNIGHRLVELRPGLVPLVTKQPYPKLLEGLVLKNVRLKFSSGEKKLISEIGELLWTGFGVSGPLVLTLSGTIADWLKEKNTPAYRNAGCPASCRTKVYLEIDLKPALSPEQLDQRLLREFKLNAKKSVKNALKELLPQRLITIFMEITQIRPMSQCSQVTQAERRRMVLTLKALRLEISALRPIEEAMVTRGGVSLKDINPRSLESRLVKGLYFAGEIMDIDADTGGFNLQAAFSTGYLAGESASKN